MTDTTIFANRPITKNGITFPDLESFLAGSYTCKAAVDEYFCYHPPDDERKLKHDAVNRASRKAYDELIKNMDEINEFDFWQERGKIIHQLQEFAFNICDDLLCIQWAIKSLEKMENTPEVTLMKLQQYRMFLNQGVTMDSLHPFVQQEQLCGIVPSEDL